MPKGGILKKGVKLQALFMNFLILTMPLFSASVLAAANIREASIYGADEAEGFFRETDTYITYDVTAKWDQGEVKTSNIGLEVEGEFYPFSGDYCESTSCTNLEFTPENGEHSYQCTCTSSPLEKKATVTFKLVDDDENPLDTAQATVTPDVLPPTIELISAQQVEDKMQVQYSAADRACDGCGNACSGIKKIIITSDGETAIEVTEGFSGCSTGQMQSEFSLTGDGEKEICVQAFDNMHSGIGDSSHESEKSCLAVMTDFSAPQICPDGSFEVYKAGKVISWVSSTGANSVFDADVRVEILDETPVTATGDISSLNGNEKYSDPNYAGNYLDTACQFLSGGSDTCAWRDKELQISSQNPTIHVIATDEQGNSFEKDCTGSFQIDNTAPELVRVGTDRCDGEKCYVSPGQNKIVVTISEADAGFNNGWVYLDLGSLNSDYQGRRATVRECREASSGVWECTGTITVSRLANSKPNVAVIDPSMDDAGNNFLGQSELTYDETPPVYHSVDVYPADNTDSEYLASGDDAIIVANVSDQSGVIDAWADLSALIGPGHEYEHAHCSHQENNLYTCEWLAQDINGPLEDEVLEFYANDTAGNVNDNAYEYMITVLGHEEGETNYWRIGDIQVMPESIDKLTTNQVQQFAFVQVELVPRTTDVETLAMSLDCSQMNTMELDGAPQLLNDQRGSTNPFIRLDIRKKQIEVEEIPVDCELSVISRKGSSVTDEPQVLRVSGVALNFYNAPFGQLPSNIAEEIEGVKQSSIVSGKVIPKMRDAFDIMKKLCNILLMIHNIIEMLHISWGPIAALENTGILKPVAEAPRPFAIAGASVGEIAAYSLEWMCAVASCQLGEKLMTTAGVGQGTADFYNNVVFRNPEKSLISSIATVCLPGIIGNLEKARQVECEYALCLQTRFPSDGTPPVVCSMTRQYKWCVIKGEQWAGMPFVQMLNDILQMVRQVFTNLGSLVYTTVTLACDIFNPSAQGASFCGIVNGAKSVMETMSYILNFFNLFSSDADGPDYCAQLGVEE